MSQRLPAIRARQLVRVLKKKGWLHARTTGSHELYKHPDNSNVLAVPRHSRDMKRGLLSDLLDDAGIDRDEFLKLL